MKHLDLLNREFVKIAQLQVEKSAVPKKQRDHLLSYDQLSKEYWNDIWSKAKEHFNTSFDKENDDPSKDEVPKIITIKRKSCDKLDKDAEDIFKVKCQLWYAGGDWELPNMYFRCQVIENSFYGLGSIKTYMGDTSTYFHPHFILIPPREAGNTHLIKINNKWTAINNDTPEAKDPEELEPKKAWSWLTKYFENMLNDHVKGKNKEQS